MYFQWTKILRKTTLQNHWTKLRTNCSEIIQIVLESAKSELLGYGYKSVFFFNHDPQSMLNTQL